MKLGELIDWLQDQDPNLLVKDRFGTPHCDRGYYEDLAFTPQPEALIHDMLRFAKMADGATFTGYKGGEYTMDRYSDVKIGDWGSCGEEITCTSFKYWLATGR